MYGLAGMILIDRKISWQIVQGPFEYRDTDGIFLSFPLHGQVSKRRSEEIIAERLEENNIKWLYKRGKQWFLNLDELRSFITDWKDVKWMTGTISVQPEIENEDREVFGEIRKETYYRIILNKEEIILATNTRIFLSHKGVDKPLVRRIYDALLLLGFEPWLDEEDMHAGAELERALLQGMKESCAAVFFVTPDYVDENYLATEIDYAINQKRQKGNHFSIITLVLVKEGEKGTVPELLEKYVWNEISIDSELQMLVKILKALPVCVGPVSWRS